jgi:hypothetical protein
VGGPAKQVDVGPVVPMSGSESCPTLQEIDALGFPGTDEYAMWMRWLEIAAVKTREAPMAGSIPTPMVAVGREAPGDVCRKLGGGLCVGQLLVALTSLHRPVFGSASTGQR